MDLVYVHYNRDGKSSYFYFIPLFQKAAGEMTGLRTRDGRGECLLRDEEVALLKESAAELDAMKDEDRYGWLAAHLANFHAAYRTLHTKYIVEAFPYRINA